jgi:hypothetical protein
LISLTGVRRCVALAASLFLTGVALAFPPVLMMESREAPTAAERPTMKAFSATEIAAMPLIVLPDLPAPVGAELLQRDAMLASQPGSVSFGRVPMQLGVDGRIDVPAGTQTVRVALSSLTALHLRSAWRFADDADYTVTVFAAGDPTQPLENRSGNSMNGDRRLIWSAITTGDRQEVLISQLTPTNAPWAVSLERVAHFDQPIPSQHQGIMAKLMRVPSTGAANLRNLAVLPPPPGQSAYCQEDIACALVGLSPADQSVVLSASRGVALVVLTLADGSGATCTGTLLNSTLFPLPFFITANHCTANAVTLDTYWFYSRTGCGTGTISPATQVTGGATFVFQSAALDSALLVLNQIPPAPAVWAGWDPTPITTNTLMLAVHHPRGDVKKGSLGEVVGINTSPIPFPEINTTFPPGSLYMVDWLYGIVEPGSSGSGFFTFNLIKNTMPLRGTLTGGNTTCSGIASRTYYQRFDLIYPYIAAALTAPPPGTLQVPAPVTFATQPVGTQSAPVTVTVTNVGGSPVAISGVQSSDIAEFPGNTNCVGSVAAGASCQIVMSFQPSSAGLRTQTVTIVSNGVGSPQAFQVSGTGSTATTSFTPAAGVWWNQNESGSGFGFDYLNGTLLAEVYSYLAAGPSQWYLAAGAVTNNVFQATLDKYVGGQCISCAYKASNIAGNDGTITITFTSATTATVDLPGSRHIQIQRYFGSPAAAGQPGSFTPLAGVWWNPNEPGSGHGLDYQNGTLLVEVYSYLANGASQWYLATGPITNNVFTATLDKYVSGQCISCTYEPPTHVGNDGTITITFTSATTATVDLPGGRHIQIQRYFQ